MDHNQHISDGTHTLLTDLNFPAPTRPAPPSLDWTKIILPHPTQPQPTPTHLWLPPSTFLTHLDNLNPTVSFTITQYRDAWKKSVLGIGRMVLRMERLCLEVDIESTVEGRAKMIDDYPVTTKVERQAARQAEREVKRNIKREEGMKGSSRQNRKILVHKGKRDRPSSEEKREKRRGKLGERLARKGRTLREAG